MPKQMPVGSYINVSAAYCGSQQPSACHHITHLRQPPCSVPWGSLRWSCMHVWGWLLDASQRDRAFTHAAAGTHYPNLCLLATPHTAEGPGWCCQGAVKTCMTACMHDTPSSDLLQQCFSVQYLHLCFRFTLRSTIQHN